MKKTYIIEDIDTLRQNEGIDDVELRNKVRELVAGDRVRLTFCEVETTKHTLMVRITRSDGLSFRGRLIQCPTKLTSNELRLGAMLDFKGTHIHSIVRAVSEKKPS